jgi:hypothetical protein
MNQIVNIPQTEQQYYNEWLLFEVIERDSLNQPIKGRLLHHSKSRDEIHQIIMNHPDDFTYYITFTGNPVEEGTVAIL